LRSRIPQWQIGAIAFWIGSRCAIDRGHFANAQAATFDYTPATETLDTPGIADARGHGFKVALPVLGVPRQVGEYLIAKTLDGTGL
jgi:hypothetical protein